MPEKVLLTFFSIENKFEYSVILSSTWWVKKTSSGSFEYSFQQAKSRFMDENMIEIIRFSIFLVDMIFISEFLHLDKQSIYSFMMSKCFKWNNLRHWYFLFYSIKYILSFYSFLSITPLEEVLNRLNLLKKWKFYHWKSRMCKTLVDISLIVALTLHIFLRIFIFEE
jgi:hypothetical protein